MMRGSDIWMAWWKTVVTGSVGWGLFSIWNTWDPYDPMGLDDVLFQPVRMIGIAIFMMLLTLPSAVLLAWAYGRIMLRLHDISQKYIATMVAYTGAACMPFLALAGWFGFSNVDNEALLIFLFMLLPGYWFIHRMLKRKLQ